MVRSNSPTERQGMKQQPQQQDQDQTRQRWETLIAKRLAENAPEQQIVQELVAKGADLHLARDFVRRIAETQPEPQPTVQETSKPERTAAPVEVIIGIVLAGAGIVAGIALYAMDVRSWGVYAAYAATVIGLIIVGRRGLTTRS